MSSYIVLARKWRPAQFTDIVGQGPIVRTLMNAARSGRIHQAYLFTGSRGVGKTSIARIFAKALRCAHSRIEAEKLLSCNGCSDCREIASGTSVDVIEIDGASNNGVDAVREIRENARFLPSSGSRKIYIIDEVHMLTTAAFNALLKTLEEPPPHVIFVFATTEPHKIPATILSRCQRFDFRRVTVVEMQGRLAEVARAENLSADPAALALIARAAEGSMRDALSLLDQVIAYAGASITVEAVRDGVGLIGSSVVFGILRSILARKPLEALEQAGQAYQQGHDLKVLTRALIETLHAVILARVGAPKPLDGELSEREWTEIAEMARLRELEELELIFQVLHYGMDSVARSPQPKVVLDVLLIKCATAEGLVPIHVALPAVRSAETRSEAPAAPVRPAVQVQVQAPAAAEAPVAAKPSVTPATAPLAPQVAAPKAAVPQAQTPAAQPPVAPAPKGPRTWEGFVEFLRVRERQILANALERATSASLPGDDPAAADTLVIRYSPDSKHWSEQLASPRNREQLSSFANEYFGRTVVVRTAIDSAEGESLAARKERMRAENERRAVEAVRSHPVIQEARSLFGGELGPIELV